jgi:hypothetical protein
VPAGGHCPGCTVPAVRGTFLGHPVVSPLGQYESVDRVLDLVSGALPVADDPLWRCSGAPTAAEYAAWAPRICGLACLRMVLAHWSDAAPRSWELLSACQPYGVYDAGGPASPGLRYRPFLRFVAEQHGIGGSVVEAPVGEAVDRGVLGAGGFLVWSVHPGIRHPAAPPPSVGGHLVLVHGVDHGQGTIAFCNPSGHTPAARAARLPLAVFERFAAPRGMAILGPQG